MPNPCVLMLRRPSCVRPRPQHAAVAGAVPGQPMVLSAPTTSGTGLGRRNCEDPVEKDGMRVTPAFPLRTEPGRRYLVDAVGRPFLLHGDTAWSLIAQLSRA